MPRPKPVCKAFTLQGSNAYDLVVSETVDRKEIEVSIRGRETNNEVGAVRISAEQFELLCRMDSPYNGLEVLKPALEEGTPEYPLGHFENLEAPTPEYHPEVVEAAIQFLDQERQEGGGDD